MIRVCRSGKIENKFSYGEQFAVSFFECASAFVSSFSFQTIGNAFLCSLFLSRYILEKRNRRNSFQSIDRRHRQRTAADATACWPARAPPPRKRAHARATQFAIALCTRASSLPRASNSLLSYPGMNIGGGCCGFK